MARSVSIDFETRSRVELKKVGSTIYARSMTTEPLCLAFAFDEDPEVYLWHPAFPAAQLPEEGYEQAEMLHARIAEGAEVWAFNAGFERAIWRFIMAGRLDWPEVPETAWRCSAALAATYALPRRLEEIARALRADAEKDAEGHRLMLKLAKPRKASKKNPTGGWWEKRDELLRLFDYCRQDVRAERAVKRQLRDWPEKELRVWQLDQEINRRGVYLDEPVARGALRLAADQRAEADERVRRLTGGAVAGTTKRAQLLKWSASNGLDLPNVAKGTLDLLLAEPDPDEADGVEPMPEERTPEAILRAVEVPPTIREVLAIWRQTNRASTKKYRAMLNRLGDGLGALAGESDGRMRDLLRYHGASTGRWAGQGIQPQNFPRGALKLKEVDFADLASLSHADLAVIWGDLMMELLSSALRGALRAGPGKDLLVADFAAIEARGVMWLSGQTDALEIFRKSDRKEGPDIYRVMAGEIYGGPPVSYAKDSTERQLGKETVLGCGYQMGAPRFQKRVAMYGLEIDDDFSDRVVQTYRERFDRVPALWYELERLAQDAVRFPKLRFTDDRGYTTWGISGRFLHCKLPSGRLLSYLDPEVRTELITYTDRKTGEKRQREAQKLYYSGVNTYTRRWERTATYGGKLTENVVQALSRDLMVDSMLRTEAAGYETILTVHDEIVSEVPKGFGDLKEFEKLMATTEPWAAGLPVAAEGWRGERYRK